MPVAIIAKSKTCNDIHIANGTWQILVNTSSIKDIIGPQYTNDPLAVKINQAKQCAKALESWVPPVGWFDLGKDFDGKQYFIQFFNTCKGFTTY